MLIQTSKISKYYFSLAFWRFLNTTNTLNGHSVFSSKVKFIRSLWILSNAYVAKMTKKGTWIFQEKILFFIYGSIQVNPHLRLRRHQSLSWRSSSSHVRAFHLRREISSWSQYVSVSPTSQWKRGHWPPRK